MERERERRGENGRREKRG
jgi:hypothetical protein